MLAYPDGRDNRATTGQTATAGDRTYALVPDGEKWKATMTVGKKVTVLAEGVSINAGYAAVVKHAKGADIMRGWDYPVDADHQSRSPRAQGLP